MLPEPKGIRMVLIQKVDHGGEAASAELPLRHREEKVPSLPPMPPLG